MRSTARGGNPGFVSVASPNLLLMPDRSGNNRIDVTEAYFHCGKALMRSKLWSADTRVERKAFPSISEVIHDQTTLGEPESQAVVEERYKTQL